MQLLSRISERPPLTWEQYIANAGRDIAQETRLREERRRNRKQFSDVWGKETWLLSDGVARLDAIIPIGQLIRPFSDWKDNVADTSTVDNNHMIRDVLQQMEAHALRGAIYMTQRDLLRHVGDMNAAYELGRAAHETIGDDSALLLELGALEVRILYLTLIARFIYNCSTSKEITGKRWRYVNTQHEYTTQRIKS